MDKNQKEHRLMDQEQNLIGVLNDRRQAKRLIEDWMRERLTEENQMIPCRFTPDLGWRYLTASTINANA